MPILTMIPVRAYSLLMFRIGQSGWLVSSVFYRHGTRYSLAVGGAIKKQNLFDFRRREEC